MGQPKTHLPWRQTTLLNHVVQQVAEVCEPVILATSSQETLPAISAPVMVRCDRAVFQGPLSGLLTGLEGVPDDRPAALVTACDLPFLNPAVLQRMSSLWEDCSTEIQILSDGARRHPLLGIYRRSVMPVIQELLAKGQRRLLDLCDAVPTTLITSAEFADIDPQCRCLQNINSPADYVAAMEQSERDRSPDASPGGHLRAKVL